MFARVNLKQKHSILVIFWFEKSNQIETYKIPAENIDFCLFNPNPRPVKISALVDPLHVLLVLLGLLGALTVMHADVTAGMRGGQVVECVCSALTDEYTEVGGAIVISPTGGCISRCPGRRENTKHLLLLSSLNTHSCKDLPTPLGVCKPTAAAFTHQNTRHGTMASFMCTTLTLFLICMALQEGE